MLLSQRNIQAIIGCGSLQFEVKAAAESLAQRQSPGLVDAATKRRMQNKLHASALIEKPFRDDSGQCWHSSQRGTTTHNIPDQLLSDRRRKRSTAPSAK